MVRALNRLHVRRKNDREGQHPKRRVCDRCGHAAGRSYALFRLLLVDAVEKLDESAWCGIAQDELDGSVSGDCFGFAAMKHLLLVRCERGLDVVWVCRNA